MKYRLSSFVFGVVVCVAAVSAIPVRGQPSEPRVEVAVFDVDATPPLGAPMAYDPVKRLDELTLRCRGVAIFVKGQQPLVLCAVDWIGIANEGHDAFRDGLAAAVGTVRNRVAVHTLHQHDAPGCDFTAEKLVEEFEWPGFDRFQGDFHRQVIDRAASSLQSALKVKQSITHYSAKSATVVDVASNRRIMGPDGKVVATRYSASKSAQLRDAPEGLIDPEVTVITLWNEEAPVVVLSYYACHPQSYYRLGIPSPDFPGIARFIRGQAMPMTLHVHFNGAGGNITAGKYNDGAPENRMRLATRLADGIEAGFRDSTRRPLTPSDVAWSSIPVSLPPASHLTEPSLLDSLRTEPARGYISKVDQLAWLRRCQAGHQIDVSCLRIGNAAVLHLPGELFVEYQLAAKKLRPDLVVGMAAYGDYGPGYIGTAVAYSEGGYETSQRATNVDERAEPILLNAIAKLLEP